MTIKYPGDLPWDIAQKLGETQYIDMSTDANDLKEFWAAIKHLRTSGKNVNLTWKERWFLSNQFAILAALYPDEKESYEDMREVINNGFELNYSWISEYIYDDPYTMTKDECSEVLSILDMFSFIKYSYDELSDKSGIDTLFLKFLGFWGNDDKEIKYMGYTQFLVEREGKFTNIDRGDHFNSHMPILPRYRKMLVEWEKSKDQYHLTRDDLIRIGSY